MKPTKGKDTKSKGSKKPQLSPEDKEIWEETTRDVSPIGKKGSGTASGEVLITRGKRRSLYSGLDSTYTEGNFISQPYQLDRNTDERLRRGLLPVEARLDLHSMTEDQAYSALRNFIHQGYQRGRRCVLVITGTGTRRRGNADELWYERSPGVLRERVPQWLREENFAGMVLRFYPAQRRHGGDGALYVLIRRKRER